MEQLLEHSQPIADPQHVISEFVTPEALIVLQQQLVRQQNSIRGGAIQRLDFTLLRYRLKQLAKLSNALGLKECQDYYEAAAKLDVREIIQQYMEDFTKIVGRVFHDSNITFDAKSQDFQQIPILLQYFESLEQIRTENQMENTDNSVIFGSLTLIID